MRKKIAIVTGGDSGELGISLQSASVIKKNIDNAKFEAYRVFINKQKWVFIDNNDIESPVDKNDFSIIANGKKVLFDCVFLIIHGTPGEDGKLQGYFDLLGIPYTSCNHATSAITFNKSYCKSLITSLEVLTAKSVQLFKFDEIDIEKILKEISLPCFVKPNNGGSSVGMSKVTQASQLKEAITTAFHEDNEVLIEDFIKGREITCGVMRSKGNMIVFPLTEIVSKKEFFDYEAKYDPTLADEIVPADVTIEIEQECKTISAFLYNKLNCKGVVRFDYILSEDKLYFLEVNTIPGLSNESIVPKMAKAFGLEYGELVTMLIEEALA
ncbi:MAG: D-alanine--D-alanine ligase [Saprospiraceae bacterium]|nr:D-alanine--D-alanine ligase [Saprospiraceae bacterium]